MLGGGFLYDGDIVKSLAAFSARPPLAPFGQNEIPFFEQKRAQRLIDDLRFLHVAMELHAGILMLHSSI